MPPDRVPLVDVDHFYYYAFYTVNLWLTTRRGHVMFMVVYMLILSYALGHLDLLARFSSPIPPLSFSFIFPQIITHLISSWVSDKSLSFSLMSHSLSVTYLEKSR